MKSHLEKSYYFVEADSFALYSLWYMHVSHPHVKNGPIEYEQISLKFIEKVGEETHAEFSFAKIYGKLVCFYSPVSTKVDWNDIVKFLRPYISNVTR